MNYYIKKIVNKQFDMDKGEVVEYISYDVYSNVQAIAVLPVVFLIVVFSLLTAFVDLIFLCLLIPAIVGCIYLLYNDSEYIYSFDSEVKAKNYVKYLKSRSLLS